MKSIKITASNTAGRKQEATNVVSLGFAPNGEEMFSWSEGEVRYEEYWQAIPGGGDRSDARV